MSKVANPGAEAGPEDSAPEGPAEAKLRKKFTTLNRQFERKQAKQAKLAKKAKNGKKGSGARVRNKQIDLTGKKIGPAGLAVVLDFSDFVNATYVLKLSGCALGSEGVKQVAEVLPSAYTQVLDLRKNELNDASARLLAAALQGSVVEELLLQGNSISDVGVQALAQAVPLAGKLRKVVVTGNGKHKAATKKALRLALKAPKVVRLASDVVDDAAALESPPPPPPSDVGDARIIEAKATTVVAKLLSSVSPGGCGGDGMADSNVVAQLESLTNYSTAIPILRDSEATELLMPLATGKMEGRVPADKVRACMAVANLCGDLEDGSKRLRDGGVVATLVEQFEATAQASPQPYAGVQWDLGHCVVPMLALSTQRGNDDALAHASNLLLAASSLLLQQDRAGDVERAVSALSHLQTGGLAPASAMDTQVMLRNVRSKAGAEQRQLNTTNGLYFNAGFEAAALMDAMEISKDPASARKAPQVQNSDKKDIFLSYSWAQKPAAKHLKLQLESRGFTVALDEHFMQANIYQAMSRAINGADVIFLLTSYEYRLSPNCQREASYAADLRKKIVPVVVQEGYRPDDWLGFVIAGLLYHDLSMSEGKKFSSAVDAIVDKELQHLL